MSSFLNQSLSKHIRLRCLLPMFSTLLPWVMTPPNIILRLCEVPKKETSLLRFMTLTFSKFLTPSLTPFFASPIHQKLVTKPALPFLSAITSFPTTIAILSPSYFPMPGIYPVPPFSPIKHLSCRLRLSISSNSHFPRPLHSSSGLANLYRPHTLRSTPYTVTLILVHQAHNPGAVKSQIIK